MKADTVVNLLLEDVRTGRTHVGSLGRAACSSRIKVFTRGEATAAALTDVAEGGEWTCRKCQDTAAAIVAASR